MIVAEDNLVIRAGELDIRVYKPVAGGSNEDGLGVVCSRAGSTPSSRGIWAPSARAAGCAKPAARCGGAYRRSSRVGDSTSEEFLGVIKPETQYPVGG